MIVVYGTVCLDLLHRLPQLPKAGSYLEIEEDSVALGGEASNTAASLRHWGAQVQLVGNPVGTGHEADILTSLLDQHGLSDAILPSGDHLAPVCHILVTPDGERSMFGRGFAEMEHRGDPSLVPYQAGAWFTTDPNHGSQARVAARRASDAGMHVYLLDFVQGDEFVPDGCIWQSSTVWAGERGNKDVNTLWLSKWLDKHDCTAILTDGDNGFLLGTRDRGIRHFPAMVVSDPVDSTGAGDMFRAGMLFGLSQDWAFSDCLRFAASSAALNCRKLGAIGGLASVDEIKKFIERNADVCETYGIV